MAAAILKAHQAVDTVLSRVPCCSDRGGTFEKSRLSPSAIVGCAKATLESVEYERPANIAVCTAAVTSPDGIVVTLDHVGCPLLRGAAVLALIRGRLESQVACACHVKPATMGCMGDPHQNAIAMGTP